MGGKSGNKMSTVKSFLHDSVQEQHLLCHLTFKSQVYCLEVIVNIKYVEVFEYLFISDIPLTETCSLVEYGKGITHTAIGFFRNEVQSLFLVCYSLIISHML